MEEWITSVSNYGFPIVVSIYLLIRLETKLDYLTESIHELTIELKTEGKRFNKKNCANRKVSNR